MARKDVSVFCAVGDVVVDRADPPSIFELVRPIISAADVAFANCESNYSEVGERNPATRGEVRARPENLDAFTSAGFNVVTFANNHHMDSGYGAFFETLRQLEARSIKVCGAGKDLEQARRPAIMDCGEAKVAFLGYSSILLPGYAAAAGRPGAVPIRVRTHYEQVEIEQPGTAPDIKTYPFKEDLEALCDDVRKAREAADIVVVTPHWGIHFAPAAIADYETEVAHAAIDAGADIVLGHHQHILKPVQVYKGKVIFHGMGNFAMDVTHQVSATSPALLEMMARYPEYTFGHRPETPTYPFHPEARQTIIVRCEVQDRRISRVSFHPCYINSGSQPEPLKNGSPLFDKLATYMADMSRKAGFDTRFQTEGDEVVILTS